MLYCQGAEWGFPLEWHILINCFSAVLLWAVDCQSPPPIFFCTEHWLLDPFFIWTLENQQSTSSARPLMILCSVEPEECICFYLAGLGQGCVYPIRPTLLHLPPPTQMHNNTALLPLCGNSAAVLCYITGASCSPLRPAISEQQRWTVRILPPTAKKKKAPTEVTALMLICKWIKTSVRLWMYNETIRCTATGQHRLHLQGAIKQLFEIGISQTCIFPPATYFFSSLTST